jgi:hypothetical protein
VGENGMGTGSRELTSNKDVGFLWGYPFIAFSVYFMQNKSIFMDEDWEYFRKHNTCGYGDIVQDISRSMVPLSGRFVTYGWVGLRGYLHLHYLHFRWLRNISKPQFGISLLVLYILLLDDATKNGSSIGSVSDLTPHKIHQNPMVDQLCAFICIIHIKKHWYPVSTFSLQNIGRSPALC